MSREALVARCDLAAHPKQPRPGVLRGANDLPARPGAPALVIVPQADPPAVLESHHRDARKPGAEPQQVVLVVVLPVEPVGLPNGEQTGAPTDPIVGLLADDLRALVVVSPPDRRESEVGRTLGKHRGAVEELLP